MIIESYEEDDVTNIEDIPEMLTQETNKCTEISEIDNDDTTIFIPFDMLRYIENNSCYYNNACLIYLGYNSSLDDILPRKHNSFFQ